MCWSLNLFTTLTNWLRPAKRKPQRPQRLRTVLETLEDRAVPDATYFRLFDPTNPLSTGTFQETWSNTGEITADNNWSGVPSIEGYNGNGLAPTTGSDPRNITTTGGSLTVLANQNNPNTLTPGGIAEFDNVPVVALAGDSTNQAPYLIGYLDRTGTGDLEISAKINDIDGSTRNVASPVALQYRASTTNNFTGINFQNIGFIADASVGPSATTTSNIDAVVSAAVLGNKNFVQFRFITADATGSDEWIGIGNIFAHGDVPPAVTIDSSPLTYVEPVPYVATPMPIAPNGSVGDPDTAVFNGGSLTVNYSTTAAATDQLLVNNQGTAVGQIGLNGTNVTYRPVGSTNPDVIGTVTSNGTGTNPLTITFTNTGTASLAAVQALLQDISYLTVLPAGATGADPIPPGSSNPAGDPNVLPAAGVPQSPPTRDLTLQFVLNDGSGAQTPVLTRPLEIFAEDNPPALTLPGGPVNTIELGGAILLDPTATVADPDSHDFDTGTLTVSFPSGGTTSDILALENHPAPAAPGVVTFDPNTSAITVNGQVIGSFTGGTAGTALVITFNSASNPSTVQDVVRDVSFQNTSLNPPSASRAVRFALTDGDTGSSGNVQVSVTITPVNNAPSITLKAPVPRTITYIENDLPTVLDAGAAVADPDSADFSTGALTVSITANSAA
jgi:hypothetical protein